jgi:hypothetical protein
VTAGFRTPGVRIGSGSPDRRSTVAPDALEGRGSPVGPGEKDAPAARVAVDSSSSSSGVALGTAAEGGAETDGEAVAVAGPHPAAARAAANVARTRKTAAGHD